MNMRAAATFGAKIDFAAHAAACRWVSVEKGGAYCNDDDGNGGEE